MTVQQLQNLRVTHLYTPSNEIYIYIQHPNGKITSTPFVVFPEMYGEIRSFLDAEMDFIINFGSAVTKAGIKSNLMGIYLDVPVPMSNPDEGKVLEAKLLLEQCLEATADIPINIMERLATEC